MKVKVSERVPTRLVKDILIPQSRSRRCLAAWQTFAYTYTIDLERLTTSLHANGSNVAAHLNIHCRIPCAGNPILCVRYITHIVCYTHHTLPVFTHHHTNAGRSGQPPRSHTSSATATEMTPAKPPSRTCSSYNRRTPGANTKHSGSH